MAKLATLLLGLCMVVRTLAVNKCVRMQKEAIARPCSNTQYVPRCNKAGHFSPKQCVGKWCFCVSLVYGHPVGPYMAARNTACFMNCQCAIDELNGIASTVCMGNGNKPPKCLLKLRSMTASFATHTPNCAYDGTYMPRQCDGTRCWCVDEEGADIRGYEARNLEDGQKMRCDCARESVAKRRAGKSFDKVCNTLGNYGGPCADFNRKKSFGTPAKDCDVEGKYNAVQCTGNTCKCVDKDSGADIDSFGFQKDPNLIPSDCQCARDKARYAKAGTQLSVTCLADGRYKSCSTAKEEFQAAANRLNEDGPQCNCKALYLAKQCSSTNCYCVNIYGHKIHGYRLRKDLAPANMTCACARDLDSYTRLDKPGKPAFHCTRVGDYSAGYTKMI